MVHIVGEAEQLVLMESPEARAARQAERLAEYGTAIGRTILGKRRDGFVEVIPTELPIIPELTITYLGQQLDKQQMPLLDTITDVQNPARDKYLFMRYVTAGNAHRLVQHGSTPEEQRQIRNDKRRQTQIITDKVLWHNRVQWQSARLYRSALASVYTSLTRTAPINPQAAVLASSAIEDLGHCLRDKPVLKKVTYNGNLAADMVGIGLFTSEEPDALYAQPLILRLVQREAAKRVNYWGKNYEAYQKFDNNKDRRTPQDKQDDEQVEQLLAAMSQADA